MDPQAAVVLAAIWGSVTGTLALVLTMATFMRDRARLRVTAEIGVTLEGGVRSDAMLFIKAVNVGRRPLRVVSAGLLAANAPSERFAAFGDLQTLPKTLNEGEDVSLPVLLSVLAASTVGAGKDVPTTVFVTDAAERVHRGRIRAADQRRITEAVRPTDRVGAFDDAEVATRCPHRVVFEDLNAGPKGELGAAALRVLRTRDLDAVPKGGLCGTPVGGVSTSSWSLRRRAY